MPSALAQAIARRAIARAAGRKRRRGRPPRPTFPSGMVVLYRNALRALVRRMLEAVDEVVVKRLPALVREGDLAAGRTDAPSDDIDTMVAQLRARFGTIVDKDRVRDLAMQVARQTATVNKLQVNRQLDAVGFELPDTERFLLSHLDLFARDNVALVTKMAGETLSKIEGAVVAGVRAGLRHEDIAEEVRRVAGVSESRAELIARDQVAKLNGELTKARQTSVGIDEYEWSTSEDERVRDSHRTKNGKRFRWDDPPEDTGHPGEDYQCRCVAIPVLPEFDVGTRGERIGGVSEAELARDRTRGR